jgi:hypothetical protein
MSDANCITQEQLKANFFYNPDTGKFYKKYIDKYVLKGDYGYQRYGLLCLNKTSYLAHRLAWLYVYGHMPECHIDHINGIKSDNRIKNLRLATSVENNQNIAKATKASKSGVRGVCYDKRRNKWFSQITVNYKKISLGRFNTIEEASQKYLDAKKKYHSAPILEEQ